MLKDDDWSFDDVGGLFEQVFSIDSYFTPNKDGEIPLPYHWSKGKAPLALITGDNASGKSFLRRLIQAVCKNAKTECIHLSMEGRATGGIVRVMVYGSEDDEATGAISSHTVVKGIETCRSRDTDHVIVFDEPDIGLSENAAAGVGITLRDFATSIPGHTKAIVVMSHSRVMSSYIAPIDPHFIWMGSSESVSLAEWLVRPIVPKMPQEITEAGYHRWLLIQNILNNLKGKKK